MGKPFNAPGIRYILGNETYVGDKHLQKNPPKDYITHKPDPNEHAPDYYLRDDHEGIISREVWEKVKAKLERAGTDMENGAKHCTEHHFLYGKVICGECGAIFKRRTLTGRMEPTTRSGTAPNGRRAGRETAVNAGSSGGGTD
jgi:hypothetical protein